MRGEGRAGLFAHKHSTGGLSLRRPWRLNLLRLVMRSAASNNRRHLRGQAGLSQGSAQTSPMLCNRSEPAPLASRMATRRKIKKTGAATKDANHLRRRTGSVKRLLPTLHNSIMLSY